VKGGTRIRLIGVDTPETGDCFSAEATRYVNELLPAGTRVRLVYDVQRLDAFGRTLAYVYKLTDGVFVNVAWPATGSPTSSPSHPTWPTPRSSGPR
jgi:endonuclease YncB( thermonuclease family)